MICPNCSGEMENKHTVDCSPEIREWYCTCRLVVDSFEGGQEVCHKSDSGFSPEAKQVLNRILARRQSST